MKMHGTANFGFWLLWVTHLCHYYRFTAGRLGPAMNKIGLILINGRQEKLAYATSVRQKKRKKPTLFFPSFLNNKLIFRALLSLFF
jgi:hypothetical protein